MPAATALITAAGSGRSSGSCRLRSALIAMCTCGSSSASSSPRPSTSQRFRRGLRRASGASRLLPACQLRPGLRGSLTVRLGLPGVLVRAVASPVHLVLQCDRCVSRWPTMLSTTYSCFRLGVPSHSESLLAAAGWSVLPPLSRHSVGSTVGLGAQLISGTCASASRRPSSPRCKRAHEGEAVAAVRHVARADHLLRAQQEHVRRVLRVVVAEVDARLRLRLPARCAAPSARGRRRRSPTR